MFIKGRATIFILLVGVVFMCTGFTHPQLKELEQFIVQENFSEAEEAVKRLKKKQLSKDLKLYVDYYAALVDLRLGNYQSAQHQFYKLSIKNNGIDPDLKDKSALGLMDAYYLNRQYQKALVAGNRFLKKRTKSNYQSLAFFKMARINLKLANWVEARKYLKEVIKKHPKSLEVPLAKQFLAERQYFAVQVGAFLDQNKAAQQVTELKRKDHYAYIVETLDQQNRKFYRVRVGQLAYLDEAEKLREKLSKQGYPARVYP